MGPSLNFYSLHYVHDLILSAFKIYTKKHDFENNTTIKMILIPILKQCLKVKQLKSTRVDESLCVSKYHISYSAFVGF